MLSQRKTGKMCSLLAMTRLYCASSSERKCAVFQVNHLRAVGTWFMMTGPHNAFSPGYSWQAARLIMIDSQITVLILQKYEMWIQSRQM